MIPKVRSALRKFVTPISSPNAAAETAVSTQTSTNSDGTFHDAPSEEKKKANDFNEGETASSAQPDSAPSSSTASSELEEKNQPAPTPKLSSVADTLLSLLNVFQKNKKSNPTPSEKSAYEDVLRVQKRKGLFRKGTMFDEKVE